MRHGLRELPGHAARRHDRMLPGGDGATLALSPNLRLARNPALSAVMPGLGPGIHAFLVGKKTWMAGTSPAMTTPNTERNCETQTSKRKKCGWLLPAPIARRRADPPRGRRPSYARRGARSGAGRPPHHDPRGPHE